MRWTSRSSLSSRLQNAIGNKKTGDSSPTVRSPIFFTARNAAQLKEKSPIARAFAGGLLFGSTGAFVGALSGLGKKEKKVRKIVFIISYVTADGQEAFLPFEDTRLYKGPKVAAKLRELCGIERVQKQAAAASVTKL